MNYTTVRKLLLKVFIGFLSLTAVAAIGSLLIGQFGETQMKVLVTAVSITAGSICAMSCAGFLERKGAKAVGYVGILAAGAAVLMVIVGLWGEINNEHYWKITATAIVIAVAFAHGCLLRLPNLAAGHRWLRPVSVILIALLGGQIITAFWGEIKEEGYYRAMAVLAVLVALVTLLIPISSKLGAKAAQAAQAPGLDSAPTDALPESLILRKVSPGVFADDSGRKYQVTETKGDL